MPEEIKTPPVTTLGERAIIKGNIDDTRQPLLVFPLVEVVGEKKKPFTSRLETEKGPKVFDSSKFTLDPTLTATQRAEVLEQKNPESKSKPEKLAIQGSHGIAHGFNLRFPSRGEFFEATGVKDEQNLNIYIVSDYTQTLPLGKDIRTAQYVIAESPDAKPVATVVQQTREIEPIEIAPDKTFRGTIEGLIALKPDGSINILTGSNTSSELCKHCKTIEKTPKGEIRVEEVTMVRNSLKTDTPEDLGTIKVYDPEDIEQKGKRELSRLLLEKAHELAPLDTSPKSPAATRAGGKPTQMGM